MGRKKGNRRGGWVSEGEREREERREGRGLGRKRGRKEKEENEQCVSGSVSVYSEEVIRELSLVPVRHHSR